MPVKICTHRAKTTFPKTEAKRRTSKSRAKGTKTTHTQSESERTKGEKSESGNLSEQYRDTNAQTAVYFGQLNVK